MDNFINFNDKESVWKKLFNDRCVLQIGTYVVESLIAYPLEDLDPIRDLMA